MRIEMTIDELAPLVQREPVTLRLWARDGILPTTRRGRRLYVVPVSLFLQSLTDGSLSEKFTHKEVREILERFLETPHA